MTVAAPTYESDYLEEYIPSDSFAGAKPHRQLNTHHLVHHLATYPQPLTPYPSPGAKPHYVFKIGHYGVGYYKDEPPAVEVTAESLLEEEVAIKKRRANNTFGVGKFDVWSD